jgi:hypothetical protein
MLCNTGYNDLDRVSLQYVWPGQPYRIFIEF